MPGERSQPTDGELLDILKKFKEHPLGANAQDKDIAPFYIRLVESIKGGEPHWYCTQAEPVVRESATFLIRLFAHQENAPIQKFKETLRRVLANCEQCVLGFQAAKLASQSSYLSSFASEQLVPFFDAIDAAEASMILKSAQTNTSQGTPPAVLMHALVNSRITMNPQLTPFLSSHLPPSPSLTTFPPGLLLLAFHISSHVRSWAKGVLKAPGSMTGKICADIHYQASLKEILNHLAHLDDITNRDSLFFTNNTVEFWSGFPTMLKALPSKLLTAETGFVPIVLSHLHDGGSHFPDVMASFLILLKHDPQQHWLWRFDSSSSTRIDGVSAHPSVVFDAIKDNPAFHQLIERQMENHAQATNAWSLAWLSSFLKSVVTSGQVDENRGFFADVLAKMTAFTLEELQHTRFKPVSAYAVQSMMGTLASLYKYLESDPRGDTYRSVIREVTGRHDDFITSVAFSQLYRDLDKQWTAARQSARDLIMLILGDECALAASCYVYVAKLVVDKEPTSPSGVAKLQQLSSLSPSLWGKINEQLSSSDHDALRSLISSTARLAAFADLEPSVYRSSDSAIQAILEPALKKINSYLGGSRSPFASFATKSAELSSTVSLRKFFQEPGVVTDILSLMVSPDDGLQQAALALVSQAFDVELRSECLRCLFENFPEQSLGGLTSCIRTFNAHLDKVAHASEFAQTLVLVITDTCDVLCSQPAGLLFNDSIRPQMVGDGHKATIAGLWKLMTEVIQNLFFSIPIWSRFLPARKHYMITLIRDVLIFGRELLEQRRVLQNAVESGQGPSESPMLSTPRTLSKKTTSMVDDLQPVLMGSLKLLRLTDMELLHQSCKLVAALFDVFRESNIPPSPEAVEKLKGILSKARVTQKSDKNANLVARLNDSQISLLTMKINDLEPVDDDEITFISMTSAPTAKEEEPSDVEVIDVSPPKTLPTPKIPSHPKVPPKTPSPPKQTASGSKTATGTRPIPSVTSGLPKRPDVALARAKPLLPPRPQPQQARVGIPDHASSSSGSESESEQGIAALTHHQKSPAKSKERRSIKRLDAPMKQRITGQPKISPQEEARRQAMRLNPDISGLYKMILVWDYDHTGSDPPDIDKLKPKLQYVPSTFPSALQYYQVFEPLLRLECWSQLNKSKDEPREEVRCRINGKSFVDDYLDVQITVLQPPTPEWFLADTDIVIVRKSSGGRNLLAKVQEMKRNKDISACLRFHNTSWLQKEALSLDQSYILSKVFSLTTLSREFAALKALPFYDLSNDILTGKVIKSIPPSPSEVRRVMETQKVNEPQAISILSTLSSQGFSLIQGPPGTGKTSTICGIIGYFMSNRSTQGTKVQVGKISGPADRMPKKKILLCAPSNAAIDEVAKRIRDGVRDTSGKQIVPDVVRIGAPSSINISTKDIFLDHLVEQKLEAAGGSSSNDTSNASIQIASLRSQLEGIKKQRQTAVDELSSIKNNSARTSELEKNISGLNAERQRLIQRLNKMQDERKAQSRTLDATRRRVRLEILLNADIICSTLSGAGHEVLEQFEFDTVIIDEAAQSIELSSLIPLKYRCTRCILVGDPKQLPPTVLSPLATQYRYNYSLFSRLESLRKDAVHLLSIQYRMHPDISQLPSQLFYEGRLLDGDNMAEKTRQAWHKSQMFQPYRFFDVSEGHEQPALSGFSFINMGECKVAVALYRRLKTEFSHIDFDFRIGIVSMYRAQIQELRRQFQTAFGKDIVGKIDFSTVDGFQGQEKDIIILSCVRGGPAVTSVGFLKDERRMNVSITRARSSLFILGHAASLERSDDIWRQIVQDAKARGCLVKADVRYFQQRVAAPTVPVPGVSSPFKKSKQTASPAKDAAVRAALQTPRELATATKRKNNDKSPSNPSTIPSSPHISSGTVAQGTSSVAQQNNEAGVVGPDNSETTFPETTGKESHHTKQPNAPGDPQPPSRPPPPLKKRKKEINLFIPKKRPLTSDIASNPAKRHHP